MVKDDLAAFQTVYDIYDQCSRWQAIKHFFARLSRPDLYLFIFICVTVITFGGVITALTLLIEPEGRDTLVMIMGLISGIGVSYFYLLKKYNQTEGLEARYRGLLEEKFYQLDRYILFKECLDKKQILSLVPIKDLAQSKIQVAQGWGAFPIALLGIFVSLMITVIYSAAPSDSKEAIRYIAWVTYFMVLLFMMVFACYDPLWSKSNKYRELLLFLSVYESEGNISRCLSQNLNLANSSGTEHGL